MKKLLAYLGVPMIRIFDSGIVTVRRVRIEDGHILVRPDIGEGLNEALPNGTISDHHWAHWEWAYGSMPEGMTAPPKRSAV